MTWQAIIAFRCVTVDLERMARFYAQIGFTPGEVEPISRDEMGLLGLQGLGRRQPMIGGPSRVDLDCDRRGRPYPAEADGMGAKTNVSFRVALRVEARALLESGHLVDCCPDVVRGAVRRRRLPGIRAGPVQASGPPG